MSNFILDSSAVLAFLNQENGAEYVQRLIPDSKISAVNVAEIIARSIELGHTNESAYESFATLGLEIIDFDERHALKTAELRASTRHLGLSLGDRSCLAAAILNQATAATADRQWKDLSCCPIELIR
ncbi:MAG: type II toxin-antitoxin system VapC family toxin [Pyrinomonadaceae bacterium]